MTQYASGPRMRLLVALGPSPLLPRRTCNNFSTRRAPAAPAVRAAALTDRDGDTIVALATAVVPQAGGVAIVRMSGPEAAEVARTVFCPGRPRSQRPARDGSTWAMTSHMACYGGVYDAGGRLVDEVLMLPMLAPRSYTREDVIELHCHGGSVCVRGVLQTCLAAGAKLAQPGEFTLRAFLNGRLDLMQAESVAAIVGAQTAEAARCALGGLQGSEGLGGRLRSFRDALVSLLAELEARLDFDDDMPPLDAPAIASQLRATRRDVETLIERASRGALLNAGVAVAIVGRPNVGKSSLLNALCGAEKAIVTPQAGTTRDVVEARVAIGGVPVKLLDTAGIRTGAQDAVERIGIERSAAAAAAASIVVQVVDGSVGWTAQDQIVFDSLVAAGAAAIAPAAAIAGAAAIAAAGGPAAPAELGGLRRAALLAINKSDVARSASAQNTPPEALAAFAAVVATSAASGAGLRELEAAMAGAMGLGGADAEAELWGANERQLAALRSAAGCLGRLGEAVEAHLPVDFWTIELRDAVQALGQITGDDLTENVLDEIFAKFCIGK